MKFPVAVRCLLLAHIYKSANDKPDFTRLAAILECSPEVLKLNWKSVTAARKILTGVESQLREYGPRVKYASKYKRKLMRSFPTRIAPTKDDIKPQVNNQEARREMASLPSMDTQYGLCAEELPQPSENQEPSS